MFAATVLVLDSAGCHWAAAAPFVPPRDAHCVAFSSDGELVAIGISGQSHGEFPPRPHPSPRKCGVVQWFELATGKRLRRVETFGDLTQLAFSPDGSLVAAARLFSTDDGVELNEVRVWDTATGNVRFALDRCHSFTFLPARPEIAVVSRKRCVVYDLKTGMRLRELPSVAGAIRIACLASTGAVYGVVHNEAGFALKCCDSSNGQLQCESVPLAEPFYSLALPQTGSRLATGHVQGTILLWDTATLRQAGRLQLGTAGRASPFFSRRGELLGAVDQANSDVVIWDFPAGRELARYTFHQGTVHTYLPKSPSRLIRPEEDPVRFAFAPDGSCFAGGPFGGIVRLVTDGRDIARFGD